MALSGMPRFEGEGQISEVLSSRHPAPHVREPSKVSRGSLRRSGRARGGSSTRRLRNRAFRQPIRPPLHAFRAVSGPGCADRAAAPPSRHRRQPSWLGARARRDSRAREAADTLRGGVAHPCRALPAWKSSVGGMGRVDGTPVSRTRNGRLFALWPRRGPPAATRRWSPILGGIRSRAPGPPG